MIYDPVHELFWVFGGIEADVNSNNVFDLSDPDNPSWSRGSVTGNFIGRFAHAAVYVPDFDAMVVSGGVSRRADGSTYTRLVLRVGMPNH